MPRTTLVLLPGLLNTRRVFEQQIEALSDIADCVVPELWRHDTIGAMADAALALAPPTFALAGFSMGGYVAFEILRRATQRVERLALMDTQATPDSAESTKRRRALLEQIKIGRFHGVQRTLLPQLVHSRRINDATISQPIFDMAQEIGADGFVREQRAIIDRADSRRMLVDIDIPTVVIVGRQDQVTPLPRSEEMAADVANSRLIVLEECGHMSPLEKPAEVTAALRRWLSQ
jgi:pimeloyl-ACP methyl ester carboxylesterase